MQILINWAVGAKSNFRYFIYILPRDIVKNTNHTKQEIIWYVYHCVCYIGVVCCKKCASAGAWPIDQTWYPTMTSCIFHRIIIHQVSIVMLRYLAIIDLSVHQELHIDGLVQGCSNSCVLTMESPLPCTKPSIYLFIVGYLTIFGTKTPDRFFIRDVDIDWPEYRKNISL